MKVAIIGGGASGLVASIMASRNGDDVYIFEKNADLGKKLLLTGNGRCNYGSNKKETKYYHSKNPELIKEIINDKNLKKVDEFFESIGIIPKVKNEYLYPFSEKSSSIKSALVTEAKINGVKFLLNTEIKNIEVINNGFLVNNTIFDKVILSTGSKCAPKTGSTGDGYVIAQKFNHTITEINPSLMQLITNLGIEKEWAGKRCEVIVSHYEDGCLKKEEIGEIQFTNYGLSGICIYNLSRDIRLGLNKHNQEEVHINFLPWLNEDIQKFMNDRSLKLKKRNITELCDGFMDYSLIYVLCKYLKINPNKTWEELDFNDKENFCNSLVDFIIPIVDTKTFLDSQTCSGGIDLKEINLKTMESLKQRNLFFTGELIDIDGDCGGFNLTIAWITGILAGENHD